MIYWYIFLSYGVSEGLRVYSSMPYIGACRCTGSSVGMRIHYMPDWDKSRRSRTCYLGWRKTEFDRCS